MANALQPRHAARPVARAGHDARVELDNPGGIGSAAESNGAVPARFNRPYSLLDGIQLASALEQDLEAGVVGRLAEGPSGDEQGRFSALALGDRFGGPAGGEGGTAQYSESGAADKGASRHTHRLEWLNLCQQHMSCGK